MQYIKFIRFMSVTKLEELVFKKQEYNKSEKLSLYFYIMIQLVFVFVQFEIDRFSDLYF